MKQYRRLVCVRRSHLKKLAPIAMLFIMLVFMLLTFATPTSASPGIIKEPSFETVTLTIWVYSENDADFTDGAQSGTWYTQYTHSYLLSCSGVNIANKKYCQVLQSVDFTSLDTISFDAKLSSYAAGKFEARVIVGSTTVWSQACPTTATEYKHQEVDVSGYTGTQNLIFQIKAVAAATGATTTNYFDNIKTWGSFSDLAHTTVDNDFTTGENDVYMYGENFESGTYHVGFYDADGTKICSDGTLATDTLAAECEFTHGAYGTWHAVVYKEPNSPPATYVADDATRVVEDSFYVQQGAIPEFPTVIVQLPFVCCVRLRMW